MTRPLQRPTIPLLALGVLAFAVAPAASMPLFELQAIEASGNITFSEIHFTVP